jgi:hypothetical protein
VQALLDWIKGQNQTAVTGVLLFALAYFLGSGVSRIAQDFFDDNDLCLWPTETGIRINVQTDVEQAVAQAAKQDAKNILEEAAMPDNLGAAAPGMSSASCAPERLSAEDVRFRKHEAAVLLRGTDQNERLYQYHAQIMVLRGATFNGLIAFSLCLFWWIARFPSRLAWITVAIYISLGALASFRHYRSGGHRGPPYMEFTWFALAAAGWYVLRHYQPKLGKASVASNEPHAQTQPDQVRPDQPRPDRVRFGYIVLAAALTFAAFFGWWATEQLYDQQIIFSSFAIDAHPKPAGPTAKP